MNGIVDALDALAVPTLLLGGADTLEESYEQLATLGDATGHADDADKVVQDVQDRIDAAVESAAEADGLTVYHELDPTYFSASSSTFIGSIYALFGLENIADEAPGAETGYPQLSAEYVVGAAPDVIVLADTICCDQTAEAVAAAAGLRHGPRRAGGPRAGRQRRHRLPLGSPHRRLRGVGRGHPERLTTARRTTTRPWR